MISVTLTNRYAHFSADPAQQVILKKFFRYKADQATLDNSMSYASGDWDGYKCLLRWSKIATGLFLMQRGKIEQKLGYKLVITDMRRYPRMRPAIALGRAWEHQKRIVDALVRNSCHGGLVISATGTGKTEAAALYFKRLIDPAVFIVDEIYLAEQTQKALQVVLGEPVGMVGKGEFNPQRITVALIQTLDRALTWKENRLQIAPKFRSWFRAVQVMIVDEVHTAMNARTEAVIKAIDPLAVFGLTATLQMQDLETRMLAIDMTGPPIVNYSITQGQEDGHLQKGLVLQIPFENEFAEYEYHHSVVRNRERNELIQKLAEAALAQGRIVVVLAERRMHIELLHQRFQNVNHEVVTGLVTGKGERAAIFERMRKKELSLLVASRVFFKGVDVPELDTIIDATGLPDANSAVQRYGRGVRRAENKRDLIYMDISDFTTPKPKPGMERNVELAAQSRTDAWNKIGIPVKRLLPGETPEMLLR